MQRAEPYGVVPVRTRAAREHTTNERTLISVIEEAREALNVSPIKLARVAAKWGIPNQEATEKIAYRRAVIDRGGQAGAQMAAVVLGRRFRGV